MGSRLTNFSYIVKEQGRCGLCSSLSLEFLGVFPHSVKETLIGWRGSLWARRGRWRGFWGRYACFGLFGRLGIQLLLRMGCVVHPKAEKFFCVFTLVGN